MVSGSWGTASIAAMRPPMAAGPMERASRPPEVLESISTSAARAVPAASISPAAVKRRIVFNFPCIYVPLLRRLRRRGFLLLSFRHGEAGVGDARIDLHLRDGHHHAARHTLGFLLDGVRDDQTLDRLEIAEGGLALHLLAADLGLAGLLELQDLLGVDVDEDHVAVLLGDLQLVHRRAFEILLADVLDLAALLFVIHQQAVDVRLL